MISDDLEEVRVEALAVVEGELDRPAHPRRHPLHLAPDALGVVGAALVPFENKQPEVTLSCSSLL